MPTDINHAAIQQQMQQSAPLLDVMTPQDFAWFHLPHAVNLPLEQINRETVASFAADQPIIVYCNDEL